jgi:hypothetical protein
VAAAGAALFNGDFARDGQAKKWGDSVKNTT